VGPHDASAHPFKSYTTLTPDRAGTKSYIITLEKQLSHLRAELSDAYRSRSTSQDKQLRLTDTLRERDDEVRALKDEVRVMRERAERMSKREREHEERWKIKDNDVQVSSFERVFCICLDRQLKHHVIGPVVASA
jgi:chromosome segregation ATPase